MLKSWRVVFTSLPLFSRYRQTWWRPMVEPWNTAVGSLQILTCSSCGNCVSSGNQKWCNIQFIDDVPIPMYGYVWYIWLHPKNHTNVREYTVHGHMDYSLRQKKNHPQTICLSKVQRGKTVIFNKPRWLACWKMTIFHCHFANAKGPSCFKLPSRRAIVQGCPTMAIRGIDTFEVQQIHENRSSLGHNCLVAFV